MINFFFEDIPKVHLPQNQIKKQIKEIILSEKFQIGEISLVFCSDSYLLEINKRYLSHDYYTDIITFDYTIQNVISGDLFISLDRVFENAQTNQILFFLELKRVIFHGILHLCGYKDKRIEDKKLMRLKEDFYLSHFHVSK